MEDDSYQLNFVRCGLELVLSSESPEEIRAGFKAMNRVLGVGVKPTDYSADELNDLYQVLERAADGYESLAQSDKDFRRDCVVEELGNVEFEATWHVLKKVYEDDQTIDDMNPDQQRENYLRELYTSPQDFTFFEQRETVLITFFELGFINASDYRWVT